MRKNATKQIKALTQKQECIQLKKKKNRITEVRKIKLSTAEYQSIRSADMKLISTEGTFLGLARGDLKERLNVK